jgi:hypothetical protein
MNRLHSWAIDNGIKEAWMWTSVAQGFYEHCGWTTIVPHFHSGEMGTILRRQFP